MRPTLLDDLILLCQQAGTTAAELIAKDAEVDPLSAVLRQSIALREQGLDALSLQVLDQAQSAGLSSGWLEDNRARALVALGRSDEALAIWADLSADAGDATLQAFARTALNQLSWPPALLAALSTADLDGAAVALDRWLNGLDPETELGVRELVQAIERHPSDLQRLVPLLERRIQQQPLDAAQDLLHCLQQRCTPSSVDSLIRLSSTAFLVVGCRAAAGSIELIASTRSGLWCPGQMPDLGFQRQGDGSNISWFVLLHLPPGESLDQIWVNGAPVSWAIQDFQQWPYLDAVDRLLELGRRSQVPLRSLPFLLDAGLGASLLELSKPLRDATGWPALIQRTQRVGRPAPQAEITLVIPLYGRWEYLRGHVAGFAMDPWFEQGRVRLLYVCDDPRLHLLHRWCAMHLAHEALDISVISLRRNMGFGMACNIGVQAAETPLVCLMNSDVMPIDSGWLDPLHQQIQAHPEQLLAPLLVYDTGLIQHAGMVTEVQDNGCRGFPANIHPYKGLAVEVLEQRDPDLKPFPVESLSAAMLLFERERFLGMGGFDPCFGRGDFEDLELSQRWKQQGELVVVPQSRLMHLERQSMDSGAEEPAAWRLQANAWMAMERCPSLGR